MGVYVELHPPPETVQVVGEKLPPRDPDAENVTTLPFALLKTLMLSVAVEPKFKV